MTEQKACKERKKINRRGEKRGKEMSGIGKKAEKESKIYLRDALSRKEKTVKKKGILGKCRDDTRS